MINCVSDRGLDGGLGVLDDKTRRVFCRLEGGMGSEDDKVGVVAGVHNLHPITVQAWETSWNLGKFVLVKLRIVRFVT